MTNPLTQEINIPVINKKVPLWGLAAAGVAGLYFLVSNKRTASPGEAGYIESAPVTMGQTSTEAGPEVSPGPGPGPGPMEQTTNNQITPPQEELTFTSPPPEETQSTGLFEYYAPFYTPPAEAAAPAPAPTESTAKPREKLTAAHVTSAVKSAELKKSVSAGTFDFTQQMYNTQDLPLKDPAESTMAPAPAPVSTKPPSATTQKERAKEREKTSPTLNATKTNTTTTTSAPSSNSRNRTSGGTRKTNQELR